MIRYFWSILPGERIVAIDDNGQPEEYLVLRQAVITFDMGTSEFELRNLQFPELN